MKVYLCVLLSAFISFFTVANPRTYIGSTPANAVVRDFLQISLTDTMDFIRWKLELGSGKFKLQCQYGLIRSGTPGFVNEKRVAFEGQLTQSGNYYNLKHNSKSISILEVNANLLHLLDRSNRMLIGNGGWSYTLNNTHPVETNELNSKTEKPVTQNPLAFEGRTPCKELSALLGLNKSQACNKMKWYFLFYTDSVTGRPSYFLMGGIGHKKETMTRGRWEIVSGQNGRITYQLYCDRWVRSLNLLKGDANILFFTDDQGRLLVGNDDFSYTLNRIKEEYPRKKDE